MFYTYRFIYTIFLLLPQQESEITSVESYSSRSFQSSPWRSGEVRAHTRQVRQDFLDQESAELGPWRWDEPPGYKKENINTYIYILAHLLEKFD